MAFNYYQYGSAIGKNQKYKASGVHNLTSSFGDFSALYDFTTFTFTNGTQTGPTGPSLSNLLASYDTSANPWLTDTEFFNAVGGIQEWTVPATGDYVILAYGARGGINSSSTRIPGYGARIEGIFSLVAGEKIKILVGQTGQDFASTCGSTSGGGGTFVVKSVPSPSVADILVIAGGGGGAGLGTGSNGVGGQITTSGSNSTDTNGGLGGTNGNGGLASSVLGCVSNDEGAGGGGFSGNGSGRTNNPGGNSYLNGGNGGDGANRDGGFGGGGAASYGGGGGGGYSGGGGGGVMGLCSCGSMGNGGGGGSYNNGASQTNTANVNTVNGSVWITRL